jgi:ribosomal protein S3
MGQKLNPTIFRLGVNKIWKTEFFEKKNRELPLYVFKDLEIRNYIERVFETNGIIVHDYKQHYNASTLNLYISYFITPDFVLNSQRNNEPLIIKSAGGNQSLIHKILNKNHFSYTALSYKMLSHSLLEKSSQFYKIKHYLKLSLHPSLSAQSFFKDLLGDQKNKYLDHLFSQPIMQLEGFLAQVFTVLNLFTGNQLNIVVNFCCVNKNIQFLKSTQTPSFISFQKFRSTPFFKEGIELLFNVTYNTNSANLLAKFIASQFKKVKRHKSLLSFLKQTLSVLVASSLSKIKGVKIIVKGRLNGVPRARHKIITIGDIPVQAILAKLDYSQTTAHNSNGSYGIKVWIVEK